MNKFWVVALETYKRNVKNWTFLIMILAPFLLIGISTLGGFIGSKFDETTNIAVVSQNQMVRESYVNQKTELNVMKKINSEEKAKKALEKEDISGYLTINVDEKTGMVKGSYIGTSTLGGEESMEMMNALSSIQMMMTSQALELSPKDVQKLTSPASFEQKNVEIVDGKMTAKKDNKGPLMIGSMFISLAMYMIILMYAQITSQEVASEKGTRIMEIILSSTSAAKHFYGKVMGIFLVILTQVLVYFVAGVSAFFFAKDMDIVKSMLEMVSLKEIFKGLLGYNLAYLLFGVLIYTILAAFCGSLVSKSEDAGKAATPVTYITIIGFMVGTFLGASNPEHMGLKIASYIPFISSFTMPWRIADGSVQNGSVFVSLAILAVSTLILLKISATMYKSTALVYSDEGMWKTLTRSFSLMKSQKK